MIAAVLGLFAGRSPILSLAAGAVAGALLVAGAAALAINLWIVPAAERQARADLRAEIAEKSLDGVIEDAARDRKHDEDSRNETHPGLHCRLDPDACGVR